MRLLTLFIIFCLLIFSSFQNANASDIDSNRFRLSGFGTLGVTSAGEKQIGYRKESSHNGQFGGLSALPDSVLGLQLDADLLPNLSATVQAVVEQRTKYDFNNILDWAYLRFQITPSVVARAGRIGADLFMLSEYRNIGFAYLWTQPVVEFYGLISLSHFEGFDLKYTRQITAGHLEFKAYGGQTGADIRVSRGDLNLRARPFMGANASFETEHWRARVTYATTEIASIRSPLTSLENILNQIPQSIWPQSAALSAELNGEGKHINYYSAGLAYDNNFWLIQSELALIASKWSSVNLMNGYFSIGRRMGPITIYSVASSAKARDKPIQVTSPLVSRLDLNRLATVTQNALNASRIDQSALSLGMRWDLHPQMALKAQWDHTWVKKDGARLLVLKEPLDHNITMNTFSLNLSFVF